MCILLFYVQAHIFIYFVTKKIELNDVPADKLDLGLQRPFFLIPHELDLLRIFLFTSIIKKHVSSSNYKIIVCLVYFNVKI